MSKLGVQFALIPWPPMLIVGAIIIVMFGRKSIPEVMRGIFDGFGGMGKGGGMGSGAVLLAQDPTPKVDPPVKGNRPRKGPRGLEVFGKRKPDV